MAAYNPPGRLELYIAFCHPLSNQQGIRHVHVFRGDLATDRIIQVTAFIFQRMPVLAHLFINESTIVSIQNMPVSLLLLVLVQRKPTWQIGIVDTVHLICHVHGGWECIDPFTYQLRTECPALQSSFAHPDGCLLFQRQRSRTPRGVDTQMHLTQYPSSHQRAHGASPADTG